MLQTEPITREDLINALGVRYDYWSARVVLNQALKGSKLNHQDRFAPAELADVCNHLLMIGDRVEPVVDRLRQWARPAVLLPPPADTTTSLPAGWTDGPDLVTPSVNCDVEVDTEIEAELQVSPKESAEPAKGKGSKCGGKCGGAKKPKESEPKGGKKGK